MSPSANLEADLSLWKNTFYGSQTEGLWKTIQEGIRQGENMAGIHFRIIHHLFSGYGLVVVLQHLPVFKRVLIPLLKKEIKHGFSFDAMQASLQTLRRHYHVQANPRAINLFMHTASGRERIERNGEGFIGVHSGKRFSEAEILELAESKPELFSPNVILRPVYQSMLLPDIAFCGGAGEVAYWLELKDVFKAANVFMPVVLLRNSAILLSRAGIHRMNNMKMAPQDLITPVDDLLKTEGMKGEYFKIYNKTKSDILNLLKQIRQDLPENDSLKRSAEALYERHQKSLDQFGVKILQEEKRKLDTERNRIEQLNDEVFPKGTFQERKLNFLPFYRGLGPSLCEALVKEMDPLRREVIVFDCGI
jgi:bacillithiol biosynthesis cysteine-adding enzyme BshC